MGLTDHDKELLLDMHRKMVLIRLFEEASMRFVDSGEIGGEVHLSIGQEGEIVGACAALRPDDYMTGNHRSHGHPIAKGAGLPGLMAELMGKATGVCKGKGGSMHLADFSVGSLGESGIVASAMPVAVGAALSSRILGQNRVVLCFFGDGAVNEGAFHESLNLAQLWSLPVVFLCENNQYAVTMSVAETTAVPERIVDRALSYGMNSAVVDGQDVVACFEAASAAVDRARSGGGPTLIEAETYRFDEHAYLLPLSLKYRTEEEIEQWRRRDPIAIHADRLVEAGVATPAEIEAIEAEVSAEIQEAVDFARSSPDPGVESLLEDMFASPIVKEASRG